MTDRLQEARDLIAAMNTDKPWTFGDTEKALSLLEWAVPEIERLEQEAKLERLRVAYSAAHVELLRQFEEEALAHLSEAQIRMRMLESQVVELRKAGGR